MSKAVQLAININGTSLSIDKKNLISLTVTRNIGDTANTFTLEVFDETAYQVENLLARSSQDTGSTQAIITVQYSAADDLSKSIIFSGIILTYNVAFVGRATSLSIEGVLTCGIDAESTINWWFKKQSICWAKTDEAEGDANNQEAVTYLGKDNYQNDCLYVRPTALFKRIINSYGALVNDGSFTVAADCDEAEPIPIDDIDTTQRNQTAAEYITNVLCPNALKNKNGSTLAGFQYYVDKDGHHFKLSSLYDDNETIKTKTYALQFGQQNSKIISFNLSETGALVMANNYVDEYGNLLSSCSSLDKVYAQSTYQNYTSSGSNVSEVSNEVQLYNSGILSATTSLVKISASGTSKGLEASLADSWNNLKTLPFEATMQVWGEYSNQIKPGNYISLVVLDNKGQQHYASGSYYITEVVDNVSSSGFIQELTLFKKSDEFFKDLFNTSSESSDSSEESGVTSYTPKLVAQLTDTDRKVDKNTLANLEVNNK